MSHPQSSYNGRHMEPIPPPDTGLPRDVFVPPPLPPRPADVTIVAQPQPPPTIPGPAPPAPPPDDVLAWYRTWAETGKHLQALTDRMWAAQQQTSATQREQPLATMTAIREGIERLIAAGQPPPPGSSGSAPPAPAVPVAPAAPAPAAPVTTAPSSPSSVASTRVAPSTASVATTVQATASSSASQPEDVLQKFQIDETRFENALKDEKGAYTKPAMIGLIKSVTDWIQTRDPSYAIPRITQRNKVPEVAEALQETLEAANDILNPGIPLQKLQRLTLGSGVSTRRAPAHWTPLGRDWYVHAAKLGQGEFSLSRLTSTGRMAKHADYPNRPVSAPFCECLDHLRRQRQLPDLSDLTEDERALFTDLVALIGDEQLAMSDRQRARVQDRKQSQRKAATKRVDVSRAKTRLKLLLGQMQAGNTGNPEVIAEAVSLLGKLQQLGEVTAEEVAQLRSWLR